MNYFLIILPIVISILTYFQTLKKDNSGLVSELSKELALKEPTPYIVECLVSKIHSMRPIPYEHIIALLGANNAYIALMYISKCRRFPYLAHSVLCNERVYFDFTPYFKKKTSRVMSMIICLGIIVLMYNEFFKMTTEAFNIYYQIQALAEVNEWMRSKLHLELVAYSSAAVASLSIYLFVAWLSINIYQAKGMLNKANRVLNEGYISKNQLKEDNSF
ncbi:hypothetical protein [Pectobacterium brasiliense]|uniref:hypothetical protein n=1 Tax=Pectobacterium brasiliense TaxID=180957 RepID=UPI001969670D|nr:hypothetical protein [Pectobacterium brasiliense]MBN3146276.1 hypothetical protein [Pectobacterium brasiliense]